MFPVNYVDCLLSLKEKLLIEEYLRKGDDEKALDILRETWKWIMKYDPKHKDLSSVIDNIYMVVKWIKKKEYQGNLSDPPHSLDDRKSLFWDWVCDSIAGYHEERLFPCGNKEEAEELLEEFRTHCNIPDVGMTIIRERELNFYDIKLRNSPLQSRQ